MNSALHLKDVNLISFFSALVFTEAYQSETLELRRSSLAFDYSVDSLINAAWRADIVLGIEALFTLPFLSESILPWPSEGTCA